MSLYPDLLRLSLAGRQVERAVATEPDALDYLHRCRSRMHDVPADDSAEGSAATLAAHLSCDVALINLARVCGVVCDIQDFADPVRERARIEEALHVHGVWLN